MIPFLQCRNFATVLIEMQKCNDTLKFEIFVADREPHGAPTADGLIGMFDGLSTVKVYEWVCEIVTGQ